MRSTLFPNSTAPTVNFTTTVGSQVAAGNTTVNYPSGYAAGDLAIILIGLGNDSPVTSMPAGWVPIKNSLFPLAIVATKRIANESSVTFVTANGNVSYILATIKGVRGFNLWATVDHTTGTNSTINWNGQTATYATEYAYYFWRYPIAATLNNPPGSNMGRIQSTANIASIAMSHSQVTGGSAPTAHTEVGGVGDLVNTAFTLIPSNL